MSQVDYLDQSSDYGQSSHYSLSSDYLHAVGSKTGGAEPLNEEHNGLGPVSSDQDGAPREFAIDGISIPSAFILEVFLSEVNCVPSSAFQTEPSHEGGKGATLDVRKGIFNNQTVALKRIKPEFFSPHMRKKYDRALADVLFELRALSHKPFASHRNIPALLGFSLEQDDEARPAEASGRTLRPVLVVEWATTDLNRYFLENQEQSPMHCAELVADIADGLQAMHMYGLSHADLKPDNVLLYTDTSSAYGLVAKLSDFGFSGSEQHQLPVGGDTPHWGAPDREYAIDNTECPGDVFSFGLVAMFVALKGNWDFRLNGAGVKDVERRQANIRDAVRGHFAGEDDCCDGVSAETWFRRWDELLRRTVILNAGARLTTGELGRVRQCLTGYDPFQAERRNIADQVVPFRGRKGWRLERSPFILWSRLGAIPGYSSSHSLACSIMDMLPSSVKEAIVGDINSLELSPLTILQVRRSEKLALRVVAVLFLRLLTASESGGLFVPGETRKSSSFADLVLANTMGALFYQAYQTGIKLGGEDREGRPEVWQLAARGKTDEVILRLERNPALIRHFHRGYTIAHQACMYGNHRLLSAILRLDGASLELMNHFGATPLICAAISTYRGGTECLTLLLDVGVNTGHVFSNGDTAIDTMYYKLMGASFQLPARRVLVGFLLWLGESRDKINRYILGDVDPQEYLEGKLSREQFARWLPNIEIAVERRKYLGNQYPDALYERLEILRRHVGPCESMHSVRAGMFMTLCLFRNMFHFATVIFCWVLFLCVVLSWSWEFTSRGWRGFVGGNISIVVYLIQFAGITIALERNRDCKLDYRCMSFDGIITIDLMIQDKNLLTLLPICLYVSQSRMNRSWQRFLTELEWIRASLDIPGSVYDPSDLSWSELKKHTTARTVTAYWAHFRKTTTRFGYIPQRRAQVLHSK